MKKITICDAKLQANKIHKEQKIGYNKALNLIASKRGFKSYQALKATAEKIYLLDSGDSFVNSIKQSIVANIKSIEKGFLDILDFPDKYDKLYQQEIEDEEEVQDEITEQCWEEAKRVCRYILGDSNCHFEVSVDSPIMPFEGIDVNIATGELMENFFTNSFAKNSSYHLFIDIINREFSITKAKKEFIDNEYIHYDFLDSAEYFTFQLP